LAAQQQAAGGLAGITVSPAMAAAAPWLGHFSAMPSVQTRFVQMLNSNQIKPSEIYESAINAALQLNEQTLLAALEQLSASLQQQEAKAVAAGKVVKRRRWGGERQAGFLMPEASGSQSHKC